MQILNYVVPDFENIMRHFVTDGEFAGAEVCGSGHINDTYAVCFNSKSGEKHRYVLQRINQKVFKNPEKLMRNIEGVTKYLRGIIIQNNGDPGRETLTFLQTKQGQLYYKDDNDHYWRVYHFIDRATTYQTIENPKHFYASGKAIGKFQKLLERYPANTLCETIPDFHNTEKRFADLLQAIRNDRMGRVKEAESEIAFAMARENDTTVLLKLLKEEKLPLRVTHNDTKLNNILIDNETGEGICLIDLDTVMPGLSLYDFGDSIRFGANHAAEDEKDLTKVWLDLTLFEEFAKGYLEAAGQSQTETEIEYLPFSSKLMTLECGIRFLTDYLNGDTYFKIEREGQNMDRCRTQFKLVADMEEKMDEMKRIVNAYRQA